MKLGVIGVVLFLGIGFSVSAAKTDKTFPLCLQGALIPPTPQQRDEARQACLRRFINISLSKCLDEARRMEYLFNEQEALKMCFYIRPQAWNLPNCFDVAKKLHTRADRDGMRLECFTQMDLPIDKKSCLKLAKSFEQRQHEMRFVSTCSEH